MIKKIFHYILGFFIRRMSVPTERVFWLVLQSAIKHKALLLAAFFSNTIAAMFEGVSLALFALAISVFTGDFSGSGAAKFGVWIDRLFGMSLGELDKDTLFLILIGIAIAGQLVKAAFHLLGVAATISLRTYAIGDIQGRMVRQIMGFSLSQVNCYPGGELSTYVGMSANITSFLLILNGVISKILMISSYLFVMFFMSIPLTLLSIVAGGLLMLFLPMLFIRLKEYGRQVTKAGIRLGKEVMEFLTEPKFLRIYGMESYAADVIVEQIGKGLWARRKGELLRAIINPAFESVAIIFAGLLLIGGYFILTRDAAASPLPTLLAFVIVFKRLMSNLSELNGDRAAIANMMPSAEMVAEILRTDNKDFTRQEGIEVKPLESEIRLQNMEFSYPGAKQTILTDINLVIPRGSVLGIVGESGSGKTTLVDLILGLYPPDSGDILMDGVSVSDALPESWRRQSGVVSQSSAIFNKSIRDNLTLVNPTASDEEIIEACQIAHAHDFIMAQQEGYDTVIGDRGHKLSGGQVQRLALVRAILSRANILILDEATSALDSLSERRIIEAVNQLGNNHTIIQVAHRLSTIFHADLIIVMKAGRIIERGIHDELLERKGEYARMWDTQTSTAILQGTSIYS